MSTISNSGTAVDCSSRSDKQEGKAKIGKCFYIPAERPNALITPAIISSIAAGVVGLAMIAVGVAVLATIGALTAGVALIAVGAAFIIAAIVAGCFIRDEEIGGAKAKASDLIEDKNADKKPLGDEAAFAKIVNDAKGPFDPTSTEQYAEV